MADEIVGSGAPVEGAAAVDTAPEGVVAAPEGGAAAPEAAAAVTAEGQQGEGEQTELEKYLAEQLKEEKPEGEKKAPVEGEQQAAPPEFAELLQVSEFVKDAGQLKQAVHAADEVWKVQTGELPAWQMIDAVKSYNPERYESIIGEIIPYIEHVTGKKFGGEGGAPAEKDPVQELRDEIAQQRQTEAQQRETFAWQQQVATVQPVLMKAVAETLGKTFGEGNEEYFLSRIAAHATIDEKAMAAALAKGDRAPLDAAIKAVRSEELKRYAGYTKALTAQAKAFRASVPATKAATQLGETSQAKPSAGWTREQSAEYLRTGVEPV